MTAASKRIEDYFSQIEKQVHVTYKVANEARKRGLDPEDRADIHLTKNMAQRVEGLISMVAPKLKGSGITKRIRELEKKYGALAWEIALLIAEETAKERFCKFANKKEAMETGIRAGFTYHTLGIVAAPLEGFVELKIKKRKDGREYVAMSYAGPIRGAGGTGASVSVLIADYVRKKMGYDVYDPNENEINRLITELQDYHERVTNLQYSPSKEELVFLIKNLPVEIDGDPTEEIEVSNYKDLPRIETNRIRPGVCLVLSMLALKAPKLWKRLLKMQKSFKDFDLGWRFLEPFLKIQKRKKSKTEEIDLAKKGLVPDYTFIADLVAGRPVLTHPMAVGGFRLRYGRTRASGFSAAAISPSTMHILNNYIATGTQLKIERPGKAVALTACDSIEGPIVKLSTGDVVKLETEKQAKELRHKVEEILFLGDILFNYGDFSENNHFLVPPGYCEEWWALELEKAIVDSFGSLDTEKLSPAVKIPKEHIDAILKNPITKISAQAALSLSLKLNLPLHPNYTYHWKNLSKPLFSSLIEILKKANIAVEENRIIKLILPLEKKSKRALELLGVPHVVASNQFVVLDSNNAAAFLASLGILDKEELPSAISTLSEAEEEEYDNILSFLNKKISKLKLRDKSGTFIGARMGRPEKAKMRKLTGSPHVLFPVGRQGGKLRSFQAAIETGKVKADFPLYYCSKDNKETVYPVCEICGKKTKPKVFCSVCGPTDHKTCNKGGIITSFTSQEIDISHYFNSALQKLNVHTAPELIKGVRGTSNKDHIPEHLAKGILRAKYNIYVNKDGTTRYDMSELPITHFKPKEISVAVEKLKTLGYTHDIKGRALENKEQILELLPQDIILPAAEDSTDETADKVLLKLADFVDDLLVKFYGLKPFYNFKTKQDIIGRLVIGLAPHISAGMIGRIIGFSKTQACFAHPLWHAALRRDCDGDEACVLLLMDALLNFSRQYLPDTRGGRTMDSPLVLSSRLIPSEVDDMVHGLDVVWKYPLDFYNAALAMKYPHEIEIEQLNKRLDTEGQYEGIGFTHDISSINAGVTCSAYKTLPSMQEKLLGQMALAENIRAVDERDVARLVIEKHFLKDTRGNLRKFSQQQFRCVNCNEKYRRPPLIGKCLKCGGRIIFTVSEGSVVKYLGPSISLAEKYSVSPYLKQSLELVRRRIEGVFGKDKERQEGLGKWF